MTEISESDWGFERIRQIDRERAERLASFGTPAQLIQKLEDALSSADEAGELRIGIDSKDNRFAECRSIVQFRVYPELYDWFFNGRTGYRSRFRIAPELGLHFNGQLMEHLRRALTKRLPLQVFAHRIEVHSERNHRSETGSGILQISRDSYLRSLEPETSKAWICERLIRENGGLSTDIGFAVLSAAERTTAKLDVPRWANATNPVTGAPGEGLRAPYPDAEEAWIDVKGGFVRGQSVQQIKQPWARALSIHRRGWT